MSSGLFHQHLVPARLAAAVVFLISMAVCLLRAVGLGAAHPRELQVGRQGFCATRRACFWDRGRSTSSSRVRAWAGSTTVHMTSELSKTAISRMRVADLKKELVSRGLAGTGIRPELQARLGEAAEVERARNARRRPPHRSSNRTVGTLAAGAGAIARAPPRLAKGVGALKQARGGVASSLPQRAISTSNSVSKPSRSSTYVMQFDGGSRGNPGPSGAGAVLYRQDGSGPRVAVWSGSVWMGKGRTNNEAEYSGLIEGLRAAKKLGVKRLAVEGDSKLVIQQMLGNYKVSSPKMVPLFKKAKLIAKSFDELDLEHIERARNGRADTLANVAMDTKTSSSSTHPSIADAAVR